LGTVISESKFKFINFYIFKKLNNKPFFIFYFLLLLFTISFQFSHINPTHFFPIYLFFLFNFKIA
jgi:hypothetical protein